MRWTTRNIAECKKLRQAGLTFPEIAEAFGVTENAMHTAARRYGLYDGQRYARQAVQTNTLNDRARRLGYDSLEQMVIVYRQAGKTNVDIAKDLPCHPKSIRVTTAELYFTDKQRAARKANLKNNHG